MVSSKTSGTTTNGFVKVATLSHPQCLGVLMRNTDGANGLTWRVRAIFVDGGTEVTIGSEENLAAAAEGQKSMGYPCYEAYVEVKSQVADSHATFEVEYTAHNEI